MTILGGSIFKQDLGHDPTRPAVPGYDADANEKPTKYIPEPTIPVPRRKGPGRVERLNSVKFQHFKHGNDQALVHGFALRPWFFALVESIGV